MMAKSHLMPERTAASDTLNYRLLRIANERYGLSLTELNDDALQQARSIAQKEVFMEQAVLASPEARHVVVAASEVQHALGLIRDRYEDEDTFLNALAAADLDEEDLYRALERELRVDAILNLVSSSVGDVDDTEVGLFYYVHREKFCQPQMRTARHILITINADYAENTPEQALARITTIAHRLKRDPRRFNEQALKHSECPTALNGGLLGAVPQGTLYPELDAHLFQMEAGSISPPLESPVGYHLLLCEEIHPAGVKPLVEVADKLRQQLTQRQRNFAQRKWLKNLLSQHASQAETVPWQKTTEQN